MLWFIVRQIIVYEEAMPEIVEKVVVVDKDTGEIYGPQPRKKKRQEPFYMTTQQDSIDLAKRKLTAMELRVLLYLQGVADYDNIASVSQAFLAKELETTASTISLSLKSLVEAGLLIKEEFHGRPAFRISTNVSTRGKLK